MKAKPTLIIDWLTETTPRCSILGGIDSIEHRLYPDRKLTGCPVVIQFGFVHGATTRRWWAITQPFGHHGRRYVQCESGADAQDYAVRYVERNFRIKGA